MSFPAYLNLFKRPAFLLLVYIFLSLVFLNFNDVAALRGFRLVMLDAVELIESFKFGFTARKTLKAENEALRKENFYLHLTNQRLREVVLENSRLKRLLRLKEEKSFQFLAARVVGSTTDKDFGTLILDVGDEDSIDVNMAVVNADGLIGKIIEVTPRQSLVQILMDHDSWVSARLENSRETASVNWSGQPWLNLNYIPKNIPVEKGELVVTSGLSQIYPEGLKIGIVANIAERENDWFKTISIKPAVNFQALEEVVIIRKTLAENAATE